MAGGAVKRSTRFALIGAAAMILLFSSFTVYVGMVPHFRRQFPKAYGDSPQTFALIAAGGSAALHVVVLIAIGLIRKKVVTLINGVQRASYTRELSRSRSRLYGLAQSAEAAINRVDALASAHSANFPGAKGDPGGGTQPRASGPNPGDLDPITAAFMRQIRVDTADGGITPVLGTGELGQATTPDAGIATPLGAQDAVVGAVPQQAAAGAASGPGEPSGGGATPAGGVPAPGVPSQDAETPPDAGDGNLTTPRPRS